MSEPTTETTAADKRAWLQRNGYTVGSRGKLSAEAEAQYASQKPAAEYNAVAAGSA